MVAITGVLFAVLTLLPVIVARSRRCSGESPRWVSCAHHSSCCHWSHSIRWCGGIAEAPILDGPLVHTNARSGPEDAIGVVLALDCGELGVVGGQKSAFQFGSVREDSLAYARTKGFRESVLKGPAPVPMRWT